MNRWTDRFARLLERKTREALTATLSPYVTEIDRHDESAVAVGNDWTRRLFDGSFYLQPPADPRWPACELVFVQSRDGNTGARNPSALGGGETDKHLIYEGLSRVAADAVMAGAETVRGADLVLSSWHPELVALRESLNKPRHPAQLIATLRGLDLDSGLMFNVPDLTVVIITVEDSARAMQRALSARPWIQTVVMNGPKDLPAAFEELRSRGIKRVSAIGGRHLASELIDAGLVQDVCLTTAPVPGGDPDTPMYPKPLRHTVSLRKRGTGLESGVVFEHLRFRN